MKQNKAGAPDLTIQELLRMLTQSGDEVFGKICRVKSVKDMCCVCAPVNGDAEILEVRLIADESKDQFVLFPAVGSVVIVGFITNEEAFISMVSAVDKVLYKAGDTMVQFEDKPLLLSRNGATLGGLMDKLITEMTKIYAPKDGASIAQLQLEFKKLLQ